MAKSEVFNVDCLEYMKSLPDNAFDLCIADPPYGDGVLTDCSCRERDKARKPRAR